jgi:hypothetical protein
VPALHTTQPVLPAAAQAPAGHASHDAAPFALETEPAAHGTQAAEDAGENVPGGHSDMR